MNYLPGTEGPLIHEGDIVSFKFKRSELTLRLPRIPYERDLLDRVCQQGDWSKEDPRNWEDIDVGFDRELVNQSWKYKHIANREFVASCDLSMNVFTLNDINERNPEPLNSARFRQYSIDLINSNYDPDAPRLEDSPQPSNDFYMEVIESLTKRGIRFLSAGDEYKIKHPKITAILALDRNMLLSIGFEVFPYNYTDSINPFSDEQIRTFKMDLFEEIMSHLVIKFDTELQAEIALQNS
ncbi:MAG: hypothetical protein U1F46_00175 [Marinagarivorans sp.]